MWRPHWQASSAAQNLDCPSSAPLGAASAEGTDKLSRRFTSCERHATGRSSRIRASSAGRRHYTRYRAGVVGPGGLRRLVSSSTNDKSACPRRSRRRGANLVAALGDDRANADEAIIHAARSNGCDLIVMASHGRKGASAVVLGSETHNPDPQQDPSPCLPLIVSCGLPWGLQESRRPGSGWRRVAR